MKNLEPCANCGNEPQTMGHDKHWYHCLHCQTNSSAKERKTWKAARKAWNKQQRQAKPREWKEEIAQKMMSLYYTIGRQMWLDCLEDKDIIEIRDRIIPVFQKHLEMRKLTVQPKTELQKVKIDNLQLTITVGQLRERISELESERDQPVVDVAQVLKENEQLREQIQQLETREEELKQSTIKIGRWNFEHGNAIEVSEKLFADNEQLRSENEQLMETNEQLRQSRNQVIEQLSQAVEFAEQTAAIVLHAVGELGKRE